MASFNGWESFGDDNLHEFHAVSTIELGELVEWGFVDWKDKSWKWDYYNIDQFHRLNQKFIDRYYYREIGEVPPGRWKKQFMRKMNEIMPKYKKLYEYLDANPLNFMQNENEYYKERTIYNEFPQTALKGSQDYASAGNDKEYERVVDGNVLDKIEDFVDKYRDIDVMILDELEVLFSSLITVNLNSW